MSVENKGFEKLQYFPASFFGMIMGITGLSIALLKSEAILGWQIGLGNGLLMSVIILFSIMLLAYAYKVVRFHHAFQEESRHPIKMNFLNLIIKANILHQLIIISPSLESC